MHCSLKVDTALIECTVNSQGRVSISAQESEVASAVLSTVFSRTAAISAPISALSFARPEQFSDQEEQATASISELDSIARASYSQHPAKLQSALTLRSIFKPTEMLTGAEAVHFGGSLTARQSAAASRVRLCVHTSSLVGFLSMSLSQFAGADNVMPTLQTVWQRLNVSLQKPAKHLHLLVISQHGACLQDYFDM